MTSYGSRGEDWGRGDSEEIRERVRAAYDRVRASRARGVAASAIDIAMANGNITPDGAVILSGKPIVIEIPRGGKNTPIEIKSKKGNNA